MKSKTFKSISGSFFILLSVSFLNAQSGWLKQESNTDSTLKSIFMLNESTGFVVGADGLILTTENGGGNWETIESPVSDTLNSIFFAGSDMGWICGNNGRILHTSNGGLNWHTQNNASSLDLKSIFFSTPQVGWTVGKEGIILKTINGGEEWIELNSSVSEDLNSVTFNTEKQLYEAYSFIGKIEPRIFTMDSLGNIYMTIYNNGTLNDQIMKLTPEKELSDYAEVSKDFDAMSISNSGILYALHGTRKRIYRILTEGAASEYWLSLSNKCSTMDIDKNGNLWAGSKDKEIFRIKPDKSIKSFSFHSNISVLAISKDSLYVVGTDANSIQRIWRVPIINEDSLGTSEEIFNISSVFEGDVPEAADVAVFGNGDIFVGFESTYSTEADEKILKINSDKSSEFLQASESLGPVLCLGAFKNEKLFISQEGSWEVPGKLLEYYPYFQGAQNGWAVGNNGIILKTENGGTNWNTQSYSQSKKLNAVYSIDKNTAWSCGEMGTLIYTTDGGINWNLSPEVTGSALNSVFFYDALKGWSAGDQFKTLASEDGGQSWLLQDNSGNISLNALFFINSDLGWAVGENGYILKTENSGFYEPVFNSYKWMNGGSLHNWFSKMGCEVEHGRSAAAHQQDGLQWPAILPYQDSQVAKGLWLGAKNFTEERGDFFPYKVVHVGPRVTGEGEFFPTKFKLISRFDIPQVFVDSMLSVEKNVEIDEIDPDLPCDRMIVNTCNTQLGITMSRKIMQFSIPGNDNYMIYDYTFTNTGNTDSDPFIELADKTITDFYAFFQYRYASCFNTRYAIGNGTGWGMNTMIDFRGDGTQNPSLYGDPPDENFRAGFAWHGYFPDRDDKSYDNIGGPIWNPALYVAEYDTVGRLGAPQFVGMLTVYADKSATEKIDDIFQPSTTGWYGSDLPETSQNSSYDLEKMEDEFVWMEYGNMSPRHAWAVEPSGDFAAQKTGPNLDMNPPMAGKPGGFSIGNGYGPYTLSPGESIHIIMAEGVNGLSTEKCIEIGKQYKNGELDDYTKNTLVLTGKDSLFKTFRNAIANYESGYDLPKPPKPIKSFSVASKPEKISLSWELFANPGDVAGFKIYRSSGEYNNPFQPAQLIHIADADDRNYEDLSTSRGIGYYYFITTYGTDDLESSRYYSQTYDPAYIDATSIPDGNANVLKKFELEQNYPNPFNPATTIRYQIPVSCMVDLTIYNSLGQKVTTLISKKQAAGIHKVNWDASGFASGLYFVHMTTEKGFESTKKIILLK